MAPTDPVPVPRWLLLAGGLALGSSLLALAFLAGRASVAPAPVTTAATATVPPATVAAPSPAAATVPPATVAAPSPATATPAAATPASPRSTSAPSPTDPASPAVLAYLDALDAALETRNAGSDPNELAQAVVADALSGRTQAIDQLLAATEGARARARTLTPPAPAVALHRDTLHLLDQTLRVYGALRTSIASGDIAGISGLQGDASELERAARAVEAETRRLRATHGG